MRVQQFRIKDNHQGLPLAEWRDESNRPFSDDNWRDLQLIANTSVEELVKSSPELLVFPHNLNQNGDEIGKLHLIGLGKEKVTTGNLMGFIGVNGTQINICSRFSQDDRNDYFLHYMLCKVFRLNLFNLDYSISKDTAFDFLLYLFPHYLKKAMRQGLFKQYQKKRYNDANVRGVINVSRHIRENIPFRGTVSYDTREHSYDNNITQLIRHTIEYIRQKPLGRQILQNDADTISYVSQIVLATPSYAQTNRQKVIHANVRPTIHPFFVDYTPLQRLCMQILRHETIKYGKEKDKVYGILFDGAWLWEEYLNTVLRGLGFHHPENKRQSGGFLMFKFPENDDVFSKNSRRLYPDFYHENKGKKDFILDAKYKHLNSGVGREDLYQVVSYMYCSKAPYGAYLHPLENKQESIQYELNGYGGHIIVYPFHVPQKTKIEKNNEWSFNQFTSLISESEKKLIKDIEGYIE
ncbi:MAG: hypothetical protein IJS63_03225 [Bacteroidaceae bacterium]|nr:hypothetical protein [Bacteroidaceae bacterium]